VRTAVIAPARPRNDEEAPTTVMVIGGVEHDVDVVGRAYDAQSMVDRVQLDHQPTHPS